MIVQRGYAEYDDEGKIKSGGELIFYWNDDGSLGEHEGWSLDLYREWVKHHPALKPAEQRKWS